MPVNKIRAVTDVLVASGLSEEDAVDQANRVLGAIPVALTSGRKVWLPGVGYLKPKRGWFRLPTGGGRKAREECRVSMKAGTIWKGETRECDPPEASKISYRRLEGMP